ncbi:MAG: response regulator, partial [Gemmatimonadales bacterium]
MAPRATPPRTRKPPPAEPGSPTVTPLPGEPLLLIANGDHSFRDTLETVLRQAGFRVITADSGPRALERARRYRPDAIILDITFRPQFPDAYAVCRALRAEVSRATPIILTTPGPVLRAQQVEALRHGAWELRGDPVDAEELSLRLTMYVQGKLELDRVRTAGLVDDASGLYNAAGLTRRAGELAALAQRHSLGLACAVFTWSPGDDGNGAIERLAAALGRAGRRSDVIGRV